MSSARLIAELDEKGREGQAQRDLLAVVTDSMTEGFMVVDGACADAPRRDPQAARPGPARGAPVSWVDAFGASGPDGQPLSESEVQTLLQRTSEAHGAVVLRVGTGRSAKVLEVLVKPRRRRGDAVAPEQAQVLLLQDVTAQRARLRELTSFAGLVAHDLRGPLTVLDGWLEVALDEDADPEHVASAIARAHEAGGRMRRVIEDRIDYTGVRQGRLRPVDVQLGEVAAALVESRRASGAPRLQPRFSLDRPTPWGSTPRCCDSCSTTWSTTR